MSLTLLSGLIVPLAVVPYVLAAQERAEHEHPVRFGLIAERDGVRPGGSIRVGLDFRIEPGWHLYWKGPSDTGAPLHVTVSTSPGVQAGPVQWPAPRRHVSPGDLLDHVYETRVTLPVAIPVPADYTGTEIRIQARADWMVCRSVCLIGSGEASLTVPVVRDREPVPTAEASAFAAADRRLPVPVRDQPDAPQIRWAGSEAERAEPILEIRAVVPTSHLIFYPLSDETPLMDLLRDGISKGGTLRLRLTRPGRVAGVVEQMPADQPREAKFFLVDIDVPPSLENSGRNQPVTPHIREDPGHGPRG